MKYRFCWVVAALLTEVLCQELTEVVMTDKGPIRGKILENDADCMYYSAFRDIPYAKPPVDDLRFEDPIEADSWTSVLNATEYSDACIQYNNATPTGSEDCLYLNVFTPVLNFKKIEKLLPVVVWINGGLYAEGSISRETSGHDFFLKDNVIFVNMNYRLGSLGFLALGLDGARGNQGLKDQNMAMRWVQKNIAKFGGDPNRVTLFGEGVGAASVIYHLISPKSKGLFQQAIAQSGSPLCPWAFDTPEVAALAANDLGSHMGIAVQTNKQLLDALKKADIKDIVNSTHAILKQQFPTSLTFKPTIDAIPSDPSPQKVFLDDCPISKLQSGQFQHVPIMLGYNKDDVAVGEKETDMLRNETVNRLNKLFSLDPTGLAVGFTDLLDKVTGGTFSELTKVVTAYYFTGPIDSTQRLLAKYNGDIPVYYYQLPYSMNLNGHRQLDLQINGSTHGNELSVLISDGTGPLLDPSSKGNEYRKKLISLWTNFAKYGNPTPHGQPINGGLWVPSGEEGWQIDLSKEEFKIHGRLLEPFIANFASVYTLILPHISACVPKPWDPFGIL